MNNRGLGNVVTNVLVVLIVVVAVSIIGLSVMKGTESLDLTVQISECRNANLGNDDGYENCLVNKFGFERASEILGEDLPKNPGDGPIEGDKPEGSLSSCLSFEAVHGLVAHYCFDNNVLDSSGFGNHGTAYNNLSYKTNSGGNTYVIFDGANDYAEVSASNILDNEQFTISFWMRAPGNLVASNKIRGVIERESDYEIILSDVQKNMEIGDREMRVSLTHDGGYYVQSPTGPKWNNIFFKRDSQNLSIYLNGQLISQVRKNSVSFNNGDKKIFFGRWLSNYFNGSLDEIMIYNRSLTKDEVFYMYTKQYGQFYETSPYIEFTKDLSEPQKTNAINDFNSLSDRYTIWFEDSEDTLALVKKDYPYISNNRYKEILWGNIKEFHREELRILERYGLLWKSETLAEALARGEAQWALVEKDFNWYKELHKNDVCSQYSQTDSATCNNVGCSYATDDTFACQQGEIPMVCYDLNGVIDNIDQLTCERFGCEWAGNVCTGENNIIVDQFLASSSECVSVANAVPGAAYYAGQCFSRDIDNSKTAPITGNDILDPEESQGIYCQINTEHVPSELYVGAEVNSGYTYTDYKLFNTILPPEIDVLFPPKERYKSEVSEIYAIRSDAKMPEPPYPNKIKLPCYAFMVTSQDKYYELNNIFSGTCADLKRVATSHYVTKSIKTDSGFCYLIDKGDDGRWYYDANVRRLSISNFDRGVHSCDENKRPYFTKFYERVVIAERKCFRAWTLEEVFAEVDAHKDWDYNNEKVDGEGLEFFDRNENNFGLKIVENIPPL